MSDELSEITLRVAGRVGACGLTRSAGSPGMLAAVDQHAAAVRDALGAAQASTVEASTVDASTADASTADASTADASTVEASAVEASAVEASAGQDAGRGPALHLLLGYARGFAEAAIGRGWLPDPGSDWESLRLAAVCQLVTQAQTPHRHCR